MLAAVMPSGNPNLLPASVTLTRDDLSPLLARLNGAAVGSGLWLTMGRGAASLIKQRLYAMNVARPNALGGVRTNFYSHAADSVTVAVSPVGVTVSINATGFRQRVFGGRIVPRHGRKYLAIPATAEAHGFRPREFSGLVFAFALHPNGGWRPALVQSLSAPVGLLRRVQGDKVKVLKKRSTIRQQEVVFWLVRSVTQRADPTILPTSERIIQAAVTAGLAMLDRAARNQQN